jgi:nucleoid DNA-binding protein
MLDGIDTLEHTQAATKGTSNQIASEEVNETLNRVFEAIEGAIPKDDAARISLQSVDSTLNALFDAINEVTEKGSAASIPDFKKIIEIEASNEHSS